MRAEDVNEALRTHPLIFDTSLILQLVFSVFERIHASGDSPVSVHHHLANVRELPCDLTTGEPDRQEFTTTADSSYISLTKAAILACTEAQAPYYSGT